MPCGTPRHRILETSHHTQLPPAGKRCAEASPEVPKVITASTTTRVTARRCSFNSVQTLRIKEALIMLPMTRWLRYEYRCSAVFEARGFTETYVLSHKAARPLLFFSDTRKASSSYNRMRMCVKVEAR